MTSRRSSIKGRGTEVLVGVPRAVSVTAEAASPGKPEAAEPLAPETQTGTEPVAGEAAPVAAPPSAESPPPSEEELRAALYEEARAGEPDPTHQPTPWGAGSEWPLTPEMEMALIEHDRAIKASQEPAAPAPDQTKTEAAMEENDSGAGQVAESSEVSSTPSGGDYETAEAGSLDGMDIQSPEVQVERLELPDRPLTDEQKQALGEEGTSRLQKLDAEIDQVYEQVLDQVGDNVDIATQCYNDLLKARDIVLRRDLGRLAQAEYYVEQVRARLKRASTSGTGARRNAWWIFAWGLLWGMVLVSSLVLVETSYVQDLIALLNLRNPFVDPRILFPAMLWGGIGGVIAIWYSLFKHIAQRDFDGHYNISYVGKPFFGMVLGATVCMFANLLIVSLGVWPVSTAESTTQVMSPTLAPWIIYLVSWVAGFKENRVFGLVDEVMKRLFPVKGATAPTDSTLP